jgi:hypothetical protein
MADTSVAERATRASKYYTLPAWDFLQGFRAIAYLHRGDFDLSDVKIYLLGQSLELTLKGWLVLREDTRLSELRGVRTQRDGQVVGYGHNLSRLAAAVERHYPDITPWRPFIDHINDTYFDRKYQYWESDDALATRAGMSPLPDFADMIEECLNKLNHEIVEART